MPPVAVRIGRHPASRPTPPSDLTDPPLDPVTFAPEFVPDLDALAESAKCSCAASDDNPY
ncbi:MAG TPA: hypothetical protein VFB74_31100 [Kribbellaceae bacterium]|nr:hypothetical protein [Kribbellaceae bacterium]